MLYCWGEGASGQLGLEEKDEQARRWEPVRFRPAPEALWRRGVVLVACGEWHTLLLHPDGGVSSCGDNTLGQLGRSLPAGRQRSSVPEPIQALETQPIVHVSCGKEHSLAIGSNGRLFSWGAGSYGQLGTGEFKDRLIPKRIDGLSTCKVIQVACGYYHSIALTKDGRVFSWGQNLDGQLGVGKEVSSHFEPQHVTSLYGIPLAQVAAGGTHSFALSLLGVVYGWGRNNRYQLGVSDLKEERIFKPYLVAALRNLDVIYISCGAEHTAVLTQNASVFTFGGNSAGQLGSHSYVHQSGPQKVDLINGPVSHLACGSYHTLAYSFTSRELVSFGRGLSERGTASCEQAEGQSFDISALISPNELLGIQVNQIFAGTSVNFAIIQAFQDASGASLIRALPEITHLNRALMDEWMAAGDRRGWEKAASEIGEVFSSPSCLTASFLKPKSTLEAGCCIPVDLSTAREVFYELITNDRIYTKVFLCVRNQLVHALPLDSPHEEALYCFLLVPECLEALEAKSQMTLGRPFAEAVSKLRRCSSDVLGKYWLALPAASFDRIVQMLKRAVAFLLPYSYVVTNGKELVPILEALQKLYEVNKVAGYKVQLSNFYIHKLSKKIDLFVDFSRWLGWMDQRAPLPEFSFCHFPFVYELESKQHLFHLDSFIVQEGIKLVFHEELFSNPLSITAEHPQTPVFRLRVQRQNLAAHTFYQLSQAEDTSLKMELLVEFEGELERDPNSAVVEFFFCVFDELVWPDYGMFMYCEQNSPMWFPAKPSTEMRNYYLFGILYGLCLFNRVLAYVPFPLALFKKLMGENPSLSDLKELSPVLGNSLQSVLDYEQDDMEVNLHLSYNITWDNMAVDLIPNGSTVAVNTANRMDFVSRYIDYVFNESVEGVFEEFKRGFYKVLNRRVVGLFTPQELMVVAAGHVNYDWDSYEKNTAYWGIYNLVHPTVKMFWKVFHGLTLAQKKGFLLFVSGSDRLPVKIMEDMHLKIQWHEGLSEEHLPEAQACCQVLLLPPYSTAEKLKEKLLKAIENNRGFGIPLSG